MKFEEALQEAADRSGWTVTKIAAEAGVSEGQARKWLRGTAKPRYEQLQTLKARLPGFARLIDSSTMVDRGAA